MELTAIAGPIPITIDRAASLFGVTEKAVRSWIRDGMPTLKAGKRGAGNAAIIDLAELITWYLQVNTLEVARTRLANEQADKTALDNAVRRGELLEASLIERAWSDIFSAIKARLLSLPTKLAAELATINDPNRIRDRLQREVHECLMEAAKYGLNKAPVVSG